MNEAPQSAASNPPSAGAAAPSSVKEETNRKEPAPLHEPAARKMDVDEDYDDDAEDEKRAGTGPKGSPHGSAAANGSHTTNGNTASAKTEST